MNKTQSAEKTSKTVAKKKSLDLLFDVPLLPTGKNEIKKNSDQIKSALYEPMHINNPFSTNGKTIINVNITPNSRRRRSLGKRSSCFSTKFQLEDIGVAKVVVRFEAPDGDTTLVQKNDLEFNISQLARKTLNDPSLSSIVDQKKLSLLKARVHVPKKPTQNETKSQQVKKLQVNKSVNKVIQQNIIKDTNIKIGAASKLFMSGTFFLLAIF